MASNKDKYLNISAAKKPELKTQEAYVVANYGDPGLQTNYFCDILSRFIIVMLAPIQRVPCRNKHANLFAVVLRPKSTWVSITGGLPISGSSVTIPNMRRVDAIGRVGIGDTSVVAASNSIPRITPNYQLGEKITIKQLAKPILVSDPIFHSAFPNSMLAAPNNTFGSTSFYNEGLPDTGYISPTYEALTRYKNISANTSYSIYQPPFGTANPSSFVPFAPGNTSFVFSLYKYQFELMMRTLTTDAADKANLLKVFLDLSYKAKTQIDGWGGYLFSSLSTTSRIDFTSIGWEESLPTRFRSDSQDCNPLIVTAPNTFSTPKQRRSGTIVYNPTYETIS